MQPPRESIEAPPGTPIFGAAPGPHGPAVTLARPRHRICTSPRSCGPRDLLLHTSNRRKSGEEIERATFKARINSKGDLPLLI